MDIFLTMQLKSLPHASKYTHFYIVFYISLMPVYCILSFLHGQQANMCTHIMLSKQYSMPEEKQVHQGTPGTPNHCPRHRVLTQNTENKKAMFKDRQMLILSLDSKNVLPLSLSQPATVLCSAKAKIPMFFHDAWAELIFSLRGHIAHRLSETRQEEIMWTRGSLRYVNVISVQQSWRKLSHLRFWPKWSLKKRKTLICLWRLNCYCLVLYKQIPLIQCFLRYLLHKAEKRYLWMQIIPWAGRSRELPGVTESLRN